MGTKSIILVPDYIAKAVSRQGQSMAILLDYAKASSVLSRRDLATLLILQDFTHYIVGGKLPIGSSWILEYRWIESLRNAADSQPRPVSKAIFETMSRDARRDYFVSCTDDEPRAKLARDMFAELNSEAFREEVLTMLFDEKALDPSTIDAPAFSVVDVDPEYSFFIIKPGAYSPAMVRKDDNELYLKTVRAILALLYVYGSVHEVAFTGWYSRYLELLSRQRIAV